MKTQTKSVKASHEYQADVGQQHHKLENKSNLQVGAGFGMHLAIQKLM